ncbi:MAG: hypothetical protein JXA20_17275 [Spirochaetes bacterium]|nr:hypothetical protein [Spirochaetota bacterium]
MKRHLQYSMATLLLPLLLAGSCSDMIEIQEEEARMAGLTLLAGGMETCPEGAVCIYTAADLDAVRNDLSAWYVLMRDVDISGYSNWDSIGEFGNNFTGTFDGNGHSVTGLTITTSSSNIGLFGRVAGMVANLSVSGNVAAGSYAGILAGMNFGTITRCSVSGTISGKTFVGGLVGQNNNSTTIEECHSSAAVTTIGSSAGGLVGDNWNSSIIDCYATGPVTGTNTIGGLAGANGGSKGNITNCFSIGSVVSSDPYSSSTVGGLVGNNTATVTSSYYTDDDGGDGTHVTDDQMKSQGTFVGWDFTGIWGISPLINSGYPYLRNNPP